MEKKEIIIIITILIVICVAIIYLINRNIYSSPPAQSSLEECKSLIYNGENKVNLVFFADKETSKSYSNNLLSTAPFGQNKDFFNIYYIDNYIPECELYKGIALLCYSKEITKKASSCPNDYIIIIKKENPEIRSSSYMNVLSINSQNPSSVISHEFGHAFAALADEYVPAVLPKKAENCQSSCDKFSDENSCFLGCSKNNYYRSIDSGLMRTLYSNEYGTFNNNLILSKINPKDSSLTAMAIINEINCENQKYYLIEGNYANNKIAIISKTIENGCFGNNGVGEFSYSVVLNDNKTLSTGDFNAELIFTDSQNENQEIISGNTEIYEGKFFLKIPVIENAKSLEIKTQEETISVKLDDKGARPCKII